MRVKKLKIRVITGEALLALFVSGYLLSQYPVISLRAESGVSLPERVAVAASESGDTREKPGPEWREIKSEYFVIFYRPDADLRAIYGRLKERPLYFLGKHDKMAGQGYPEKIAARLDALFRRAEKTLGMNPRVKTVTIRIFKDQDELNEEYRRLFGNRKSYVSFYVYKYNTIYTTESAISDSVMAHEMGHAIVDHYFVIRPPESVREILATYVDKHLED